MSEIAGVCFAAQRGQVPSPQGDWQIQIMCWLYEHSQTKSPLTVAASVGFLLRYQEP